MTWSRNSTAFSEDAMTKGMNSTAFFGRCRDQGHVLYPFGKFINQHEYKLEVT
jgi:hypothetical protein